MYSTGGNSAYEIVLNFSIGRYLVSVGIFFALLLAYSPTPAFRVQQPGTAMVFYAQTQMTEDLWADLFQSLPADLAAGIDETPKGFALQQDPTYFRGNRDLAVEIDFSKVIVVKLLGRCDALPRANRPSLKGPLGWVLEVSGTIQPFIFVDCERLAQVLRTRSAGLNKDERRHEMAQAIAHVVIHEWIHIATQSPSHGAHGITKQFLSPAELIAEPKNNTVAIATH
jgi:hypothetical protein